MDLIILSIGMKTARIRGGCGIYTCKYQGSNIKHNTESGGKTSLRIVVVVRCWVVQCIALDIGEKALVQL